MLRDTLALQAAGRFDGAGYLAGYVIECSLKSVLLLESLARSLGATTLPQLMRAMATRPALPAGLPGAVRKQVGHDLARALRFARGAILPAAPLFASGVTAKYLGRQWHRLGALSPGLRWRPELRYTAEGAIAPRTARRWAKNAATVLRGTVTEMRADGVVFG